MTDVEVYAFVGKWVGYAVTTFVFAGAGAYFGAYLRKKGENLATREDLGLLVEQMKAVTKATREIEASISTDVWHRQTRWELRRDAILKALSDLATAIPVGMKMLWTYKHSSTDSHDDKNARRVVQDEFQMSMESFWKSKLTATIVCGTTVAGYLNDIDLLLATAKTKARSRAFDEGWKTFDEIDNLTDRLSESVRDDLGFEVNMKITRLSNESSAAPSPDPPGPEAST